MKREATETTRITEAEREKYEGLATVFKALANPTRIIIVHKLAEQLCCVCDLTTLVGADTSTISRHLSVLKNAGLVTRTKRGTSVYYSLSCGCMSQLLTGAQTVLRENLDHFRRIVEGDPGNVPEE